MNAVDVGVYNALTGASGLTSLLTSGASGVFAYTAPPTEDPPYVVFNEQSRVPRRVMSGGSVGHEDLVYLVKGVTESWSSASAGTIANQIDTALDNAAVTVSGYTLMMCERIQTVNYVEFVDGKRFNHHGALYRVMIDPS